MGPDDDRCLECKAEKRGCSFKEVKQEKREEDVVEIISAKRPRRSASKKASAGEPSSGTPFSRLFTLLLEGTDCKKSRYYWDKMTCQRLYLVNY